jgi:hypothetical protein
MNRATTITQVLGLILAVPPLLAIIPLLRNPAGRMPVLHIPARLALACELIGAGMVTAALLSAGQVLPAIVPNALWVVACSTVWLRSANKLRLSRQRAQAIEQGS